MLRRQVVECSDVFLIGLTATPNHQTFGFFKRNLVVEYYHEQAVATEGTSRSTCIGSRPVSRKAAPP